MSSLMDEIGRDVEDAPRLRVENARLRSENARLRSYAETSAREVDELRSRVVEPLLAIDLREAGATTRCFEFVRGVQSGAAQMKGAE